MVTDSSHLRREYDENGYVVVDNLVSSVELSALRDACTRVVSKTRSGDWPHRRVVGKQFPPYDSDNPDSWGVQHLLHPDLNEPIFARWYAGDPLINVIKTLLSCEEEHLQMGKLLEPHGKVIRTPHKLDLRTFQSVDKS